MQENTTTKRAVTVTALTDRRRGGLKFLKNQPVTVPLGEDDKKLLDTLMDDPILNVSAPFELEPEEGEEEPSAGDDASTGGSEPRSRKPATKAPAS
ncbi:hypothetical protein [Polycladidibacter stylochi]|uniref:hypothetical protein n=1 Tax=Polycladidibacter stylochi TaxID=1807766 RepID=UPI000830D292|nr:hypothetical protein [Pseudovibrio stylochi]